MFHENLVNDVSVTPVTSDASNIDEPASWPKWRLVRVNHQQAKDHFSAPDLASQAVEPTFVHVVNEVLGNPRATHGRLTVATRHFGPAWATHLEVN